MPEAPESDILQRLCKGIRTATTTEHHAGRQSFELPFTYRDASPITLVVEPNGTIHDDGRTLLTLFASDDLEAFQEWDGFAGFNRIHSIRPEGSRLFFGGSKDHELVRFVEGLRDLGLVAPETRERSKAFPDMIRRNVTRLLTKRVRNKALDLEEAEAILNPNVFFEVDLATDGMSQKVAYEADVDFRSVSGNTLFIVLSYATSGSTDRRRHIRDRLSSALVARTKGGIDADFVAVIPPDGYLGSDLTDIQVLTGSEPLRIDPVKPQRLVAQLLEQKGKPSAGIAPLDDEESQE